MLENVLLRKKWRGERKRGGRENAEEEKRTASSTPSSSHTHIHDKVPKGFHDVDRDGRRVDAMVLHARGEECVSKRGKTRKRRKSKRRWLTWRKEHMA